MSHRRRALVPALALFATTLLSPAAASAASPAPRLRVAGNRLVDAAGATVQLRGVNRSSPETQCQRVGVTTFFKGPSDAASVAAIRAWGVNAVRVPVNEDCWLGRNGLPLALDAAAYRAELTRYVRLVVAAGMYAVVDVHFAETTAAGVTSPSVGFAPMPDKAHGAELWRSIATAFKGQDAVLLDLYNEPHDVTWACWRDGCTDPVTGSAYVGMRELVGAVRSTGATNVLVATGPSWGNEVSRWLSYAPRDPLGRLVAGVHLYPESGCSTVACLDERVRPVAAVVPVLVGEFGDTGCAGTYLTTLTGWADPLGVSYLAFTWNTSTVPCPGYGLILAYDGTPSPAGSVYRAHLLGRRTGTRASRSRLRWLGR